MQELLDETIKACIHCGICLPACPTYKISGNEGYSPRGRIYLINEYLKNSSGKIDPKLFEYLDTCLACYACQTVCPSQVDYASILDFARRDLKLSKYSNNFLGSIFDLILSNRAFLAFLRQIAKYIPLPSNFPKPNLDKLYRVIKPGTLYKSKIKNKTIKVSLALGCIVDTFYNEIHHDTIKVLNAFGYDVFIPDLACCGSLALHSGQYNLGAKQEEEFIKLASELKMPIVFNSAGCGASIKHSGLVVDFIELIQKAPYNPLKNLKHSGKDIVYHPACHLNHRQGLAYDYANFLSNFYTVHLPEQADLCCGSAGIYNLLQSQMAAAIGKYKAKTIKDTGIDLLVTANAGCINQLQHHLGKDCQVLHPISLLAALCD